MRAKLHSCSSVTNDKPVKVEEPKQAEPEEQAELAQHQQPKEQEVECNAWVSQVGAGLQLSLPAHAATPPASSSAAHTAATVT